MNRAWNLTRADAVYRHEQFSAGLRAAGFAVTRGDPVGVLPGDVLLIWNRYAVQHSIAEAFERAGGTVLVTENGYLGPGGASPHGMNPREWYALARQYHNDSTVVRAGDASRFERLRVEVKPWRTRGNHILVCPNRLFGTPGRIMPTEWTSETRRHLEKLTNRPLRTRPHPGNEQARVPFADDLGDCWAVVIWNSSVGVQALVAGIPVICCAPNWICKAVSSPLNVIGMSDINRAGPDALLADGMRRSALANMANSQFHIEEIASGEAFKFVLGGNNG